MLLNLEAQVLFQLGMLLRKVKKWLHLCFIRTTGQGDTTRNVNICWQATLEIYTVSISSQWKLWTIVQARFQISIDFVVYLCSGALFVEVDLSDVFDMLVHVRGFLPRLPSFAGFASWKGHNEKITYIYIYVSHVRKNGSIWNKTKSCCFVFQWYLLVLPCYTSRLVLFPVIDLQWFDQIDENYTVENLLGAWGGLFNSSCYLQVRFNHRISIHDE